MKYHVCVSLKGYREAETEQEAEDKAFDEFENQNKTYAVDIYPIEPKKRTYRLAK